MDNFSDEDIDLFIQNYNMNISNHPLRSSKITTYVQYLKTKKHFRDNYIDEDPFFKKRFQITTDDIVEIHKLIDKIKRGGDLIKKSSRYNVTGNLSTGGEQIYDEFDENEEYTNKGFELLDQVQSAMDSYYKKMNKTKNSRTWKTRAEELNRVGSVKDVPNRYYNEGINSERPNIEYDVQGFARSELMNMGTSNIIQKLDNMNTILDNNQIMTNNRGVEQCISCNKKNQFHNEIQPISNQINNQVDNQEQDIAQRRFFQDNDILNQRGITRNNCIKNKNPFEHQFDYLECNYNRTPDPRLVGESSRMDNRSMMKR